MRIKKQDLRISFDDPEEQEKKESSFLKTYVDKHGYH